MGALDYWWFFILLGGPALGFLVGPELRRLSARVRWALGGAGLAVILVGFSPASLPGSVADHILLGFAYLAVCLAMGSAERKWVRYGGLIPITLATAFAFSIGGFLTGFAIGQATLPDGPTHVLDCGYRVRMEPYGWVAHSGVEAVVLWRPWWSPLEVERAREQFDDMYYVPDALVPTCRDGAPVVLNDEEEIWRFAPRAG